MRVGAAAPSSDPVGVVTETDPMKRTVTADIDLDVTGPGRVVFQVAVAAAPGLEVHENFVLTLDGTVISAREVIGVTGSRFHVVEPQPGKLLLSYTATATVTGPVGSCSRWPSQRRRDSRCTRTSC